MIDLSHLTEEEQGVIMTVLKRDAELKKAEEERVKQLQSLLIEENQLKYMTGEWFYEVKSQRHQDRIHGSEIILASMKQKKPDFTRSLERPRRGSGYDDVMMSTAKPLSQQTEEGAQRQSHRKSESLPSEARQEVLRLAMRSPKLRHNPFNNVQVEFDTDRPCPQLTNGTQRPIKTLEYEVPSAQKELVNERKAEEPEVPAKRPAPVPRKRTKLPRNQSSRTDSSGSGVTSPTTSTTSTTRGILKPASSCSSVDSHQREPAGMEGVLERESEEATALAVGRREERVREKGVTHVVRTEEEKQDREEERRVEERREEERTEEGARHFVPVSLAKSEDEWQKAEMPVQHTPTSVQQRQRETSSRSPVGQQRETTPRSKDEGQWRETPPQMSRPKHDVSRGLGLSVFTSPEEWKPSGGRAQPLTSPYSSNGARLALLPNSDQPPPEKVDPQSTQHRWRESSADKTQLITKDDSDSRAKNTTTETTKTAEGALYEFKRTVLPSAAETSAGVERTKSPVAPVTPVASVTPVAPVTPMAPASQTSKLTEEEGASIAKVLEWFNRSTDSSNRPDTDSAQDLEETKDNTTDSEEEAEVIVSKPAANVYTIIPRQDKPKEKKKLIPDDTCWADEQSVDLSDEVPEQSDPLRESPTITVRPFQLALSRDAAYQLRQPVPTAAKPETSYQPQQPTQSPLLTETSYQSQQPTQSPLLTDTGYQSQQPTQSPLLTDTGYQSQQPTQSPLQTETNYHSKRSIPSSLQTETNYQSKRSISSALQTESTFQSKRSVQSPLQTESTYQSKRSVHSPLQTESSYQQPIQSPLQTATSYHSKRSIQSPLQTENSYQSKRSIQSPHQEEINYKSHRSIQSPLHTETQETNRTASQSKQSMQSAAKTETTFQPQRPASSTTNKEVTVQAHPPVHSVLKTETAFKAQQYRPDTQRQGADRREEDRTQTGAKAAAGGDARLDSKVSQQQDNQDERPKIANLKSFWERGSSGPKILISRTNLNTEKKMALGQQVDREQSGRQQELEPQRNFEVRSMSSSLNPSNEGKPQRKQITEVKAQKEREEVSAGQQKYITAGFGDENVSEIAYSTQGSGTFEVNNLIEQDVIPIEVTSPPVSVNTSRFAKKVSEEAMKCPRIPVSEDILKHPREEAVKYPRTANEPSVPSTHPEHAPKPEEHEEEMLPESRSLSRTSTPGLSSSPVLQTKQNQNTQHLENRREKLRQLKSFWESEISASKITSGRSRDAESKSSGSSSSTLNKRFTKSAFDLRSMGLSSTDDFDDVSGNQSFSGFTTKDKTEKPPLGDANFKSLRNFWSGSSSAQARPKSPTSKDKLPGSTGVPRSASPQTYGRPREEPSSPSLKSRHKGRDEGSTGSSCRRTSVDSRSGKSSHRTTTMEPEQNRKGVSHHQSRRNSEQVSLSSSLALKNRTGQPPRRTSTGNLNERAGGMRRATSMYSLAFSEDQEQTSPKPSKRSQELGTPKPKKTPEFGLSFSKKGAETGKSRERLNERRPSTERRPSRTSDDPEWQPLARSFIPRDYQHYLGIPEKTGTCPTAQPPEPREELCTSFSSQPDCELSRPSGPARSSTPVGMEEGGGRRGSLGTRPIFAVPANEDFSQESPRSSASESWSSSRNNSKCEEEDDGPVQRALRRAAARPTFTKSLEDITIATGPERESEKTGVFMHSSGDASPDASTLASSFSEPEHVRKMSKSVPSFLQEDALDDNDSEESSQNSHGRRPYRMGISLANLSGSSGMASVSSVSGSVMSVCSGDFGGVEVQGTIQFTLNYVQKLKEFHIFVVQCKNLAAVDAKRSRSDPYVKSYLIPDKAGLGKRKTSVKKKTMNPLFNEILRYRVRMDYLKSQVLNLSAWHHDTFGKNSFLGEVEVDLSVWDFNNTQMNYMSLNSRTTSSTQPTEYKGEMRLSIRYLPQMSYSKMAASSGEVHIWVKECKNLPLVRGATIDPYVKCFVLPDTSRKSRQKTRVLKRTDCPVFNHTMVYDGFQPEDLREACVELTVWDRDRLANHLLGGLRLGMGTGKSYGALVDWMDSTGQEVALWERMMENPTEWVEDVLPLRVLMTHANK